MKYLDNKKGHVGLIEIYDRKMQSNILFVFKASKPKANNKTWPLTLQQVNLGEGYFGGLGMLRFFPHKLLEIAYMLYTILNNKEAYSHVDLP